MDTYLENDRGKKSAKAQVNQGNTTRYGAFPGSPCANRNTLIRSLRRFAPLLSLRFAQTNTKS